MLRKRSLRLSRLVLIICIFLIRCIGCDWHHNSTDTYTYREPKQLNDGWETASLTDVGIDEARIYDMMNYIYSEYDFMRSLLIVRSGKLVLEEYFGECNRQWLLSLASGTKSIVSTLIGIALDKGLISSIDESIFNFFPEYANLKDSTKEAVTIRHLLMMASGFDWNELYVPYSDPNNDNYIGNQAPSYLEYALGKTVVDTPGTFWNYNSGCSIILGGIIKNATGLRADAFAEAHLFQASGIHAYHWLIMNGGVVSAHGGLSLLSRDMAKFGQLYLQNGIRNGKRILSEHWVTQSTKVQIQRSATTRYDSNSAYGYQWWIDTINGHKISYACGYGGQFIFIISDLNIIVVTAAETGSIPDIGRQHERIRSLLGTYILPAVQ